MFDHERLDAYRLSVAFAAWVSRVLDTHTGSRRPSALKHLDEASTSIALNIAEGNGKRSPADRARYLEISRGSALECAACIDVLLLRHVLTDEHAENGKVLLHRIVSTLTRLITKLLEQPSTGASTSTSTAARR